MTLRMRFSVGGVTADTPDIPAAEGGVGYVLNVSALPVANRQLSNWGTVQARLTGSAPNRGLARGTVYSDAITGFPVLSLGQGQFDYSEAGPSFSASDADGNCYVVWNTGSAWEVGTLTYHATTPTITNVRTLVVQPGLDTAHCFSQNPSTPYYLYVINSAFVIHRIDVRTNTLVTGGNFPKSVASALVGTSAPAWLTVSNNDTRFAFQRAQAESAGVWTVAGDTVLAHDQAWFEAELPYYTRFDEIHLSDSGRYAAILCGTGSSCTFGTWTSLGGGVYQTTAALRRAGGIGLGSVSEISAAALTRRPDGTTALLAGEWSVDAISGETQILRVRMVDSGVPTGRVFATATGVSEPMGWWDTQTDRRSRNLLPNGQQMSHVAWQGDVLYAQNPGASTYAMAKATAVPVTTDGQTVTGPTEYATSEAQSVNFQHSCAFMELPGRAADQQFIVGADLLAFSEGVIGTWTALGGGIFSATVDLSAYRRSFIGIRDVVLIDATTREHLATLTRRADGTTGLAAGEWSVDAVSSTNQLLRVRLTDSSNPTGKVRAYAPRLNHTAVAALRNDGAEARILMQHNSYGFSTNAYLEYPKAQIQRDGLWCATNSNHGIPGNRIDVLVAQLPRVARS